MLVVSLKSELDASDTASLVNLAAMDADLATFLSAQSQQRGRSPNSNKSGPKPKCMYDGNYDSAQIAAFARLTESSELSAERSAALNFILTSPAHFRRLQDDLRSARVFTTRCLAEVLNNLLADKVRAMKNVREEALAKIRDEREREREHARKMGLLPFLDLDDEVHVCANTANNHGMGGGHKLSGNGNMLDWEHFLAGLTNVANNLLKQSSSTFSDDRADDVETEHKPSDIPLQDISSSKERTITASNVCKTTYLHMVPETLPLSSSPENSGRANGMPPSRPKSSAGAHRRPRAARGA